MKKRVLALLGVVCLCIGMLPLGAAATEGDPVKVGDVEYATVSAALNAAEDAEVEINIIADLKEDVVIPQGKTVKLNIAADVTLTNQSEATITNNGTLTVTGEGTVDNITHGKAAILNKGTATLQGCTFTRSLEAGTLKGDGSKDTVSGGNSYYTIRNEAALTIDAPTVVTTRLKDGDTKTGMHSSLISTYSANPASLTINGGTFTGGKFAVKNDGEGECQLTINGGDFTSSYDAAIQNWDKTEINGGTFTAGSPGAPAVVNWYNTDRTNNHCAGELVITNGTFNAGEGAALAVKNDNYGELAEDDEGATANISGGTYTAPVEAEYLDKTVQFQVNYGEGEKFSYHKTYEEAQEAAKAGGGTLEPKPNANGDLAIVDAETDISLYAKVTVSGMIAEKTYAVRFAQSDTQQTNMTIIILEGETTHDFYTQDGQLIWVFELDDKGDLIPGEDGTLHYTSLVEHTAEKVMP